LGQNGLLTLSKYPIVSSEIKHFSQATLPDSLMHKGALKVTILVGANQRFNIWNVHLQDGASPKVRSRQLGELIKWVHEAHDGQVADIVGGDFNFTPGSSGFRQVVAEIGPDIHQLAGDSVFSTWDDLKPGAQTGEALDHIFVKVRQGEAGIGAYSRRIFAASRQQDRFSDHMGMEASLYFETSLRATPAVLASRESPVLVQTAAIIAK
jgi:endonuclease/exonuclease/phosphatase family metal-dependent hydrolase